MNRYAGVRSQQLKSVFGLKADNSDGNSSDECSRDKGQGTTDTTADWSNQTRDIWSLLTGSDSREEQALFEEADTERSPKAFYLSTKDMKGDLLK